MKKILLTISFCFSIIIGITQNIREVEISWEKVDAELLNVNGERRIDAKSFSLYKINDLDAIVSQMSEIRWNNNEYSNLPELQISIPVDENRMVTVISQVDQILPKSLADQFPDIHVFSGRVKEKTGVVKWDITPHGFHAMVMLPGQSTIFIDPYIKGNAQYYIVYSRKDFITDKIRNCEVVADLVKEDDKNLGVVKSYGTCQLRTYRLALAATGEYTMFNGGTVSLALAAQVTTMNRVNGIYERDMAVRMNIISNNNLIIYTNSNTDPYSNNDGGSLLNENQANLTSVIGSANYDIGHVFSTGGGGVAGLGVVCSSTNKAWGVTGSYAPIGDAFDVDYVAHEIGHQFGCNHTFSNTNGGSCAGNTNSATSMEPGSGSTIMAYAGICSSYNVQSNSDDYFHAVSLQEMSSFITGAGHTCPVVSALSNTSPTVTVESATINIPIGTPFFLTAQGTDSDATNTLSYCWEQVDAGSTNTTPIATQTSKVNFRSFDPSTSPTRYFPNLNSLAANGPFTWEVLPTVARTMNFRVVVRDNAPGGGCNDFANLTVNAISSAGPFVVSYPSLSGISWIGSSSQNIVWDVANTNNSPLLASLVDIILSTDGGANYNMVLANSVPNDGSHAIIVPNIDAPTCRVMVRASGKNFFDISNNNFQINPISYDFTLTTPSTAETICQGVDAEFLLDFGAIGIFNESVDLELVSPIGMSASLSSLIATPGQQISLNVTGTSELEPGQYTLLVNATGSTGTKMMEWTMTVLLNTPPTTNLISPADQATGVDSDVSLSWQTSQENSEITYYLQVAYDNTFSNLYINESALMSNSFNVMGLYNNMTYYWRVKVNTICGSSDWSSIFSFTTSNCNQYYNSGAAVVIPSVGVSTITSTITVPSGFGSLTDVNIPYIIGSHTYVGDLRMTLTSPSGTSVILVNQVCDNYDNFNFGFDDASASSIINCPVTSGHIYTPNQLLSAFSGEQSSGIWTLQISDLADQDGGVLEQWSIEVCASPIEISGCTNVLACNYNPESNVDNGSCILPQPETCNDLDDDCNGLTDDGLEFISYFIDADLDGVGSIYGGETCNFDLLPGFSYFDGDCDDNDPMISPFMNEVCNGVDDNCDGEINEGLGILVYLDDDGDGFGNDGIAVDGVCELAPGLVEIGGDCNDQDASVNPEGIEICGDGLDNNCDGLDEICPIYGCTDPTAFNYDALANTDDGSCIAVVEGCTDLSACNYDFSANVDDGSCILPQPETCNDLDDDCNGLTDDGLEFISYFIDADLDGVGSIYGGETCNFDLLPGFSYFDGDCDDNDPMISPFMNEVCNGIDDNCDGEINEGLGILVYLDDDGDGFGNDGIAVDGVCELAPGLVEIGGDCNDQDASVNPEGIEICGDGLDNNCDGLDEICPIYGCTDPTAFNYDALANTDDGSCIAVVLGCTDVSAFNYNASANTDDGSCIAVVEGCTDASAFNYNPSANTDDGSCIAVVLGCTDATAFNYNAAANTDDGSCIAAVLGCTDASAFNYNAAANTDDGSCIAVVLGCTDASAFNYNPAANTDDGSCISVVLGCTDPSAFNYNAAANTDDGSCIAVVLGCTDVSAFNYNAAANTDDGSCIAVVEGCTDMSACNYDFSANVDNGSCILPQQEICNDLDDNCNGLTDDGLEFISYFIDADLDGVGSIYGGETCNFDLLPGFSYFDGDCDDNDAMISPFMNEVCNGVDDNCDGEINEGLGILVYLDDDGDGYGNDGIAVDGVCELSPGLVEIGGDCNDQDASVNPAGFEICGDGIDNNCDGLDEICPVFGCIDPTAFNYNPAANTDDGSCIPVVLGCTDASAFNYNPAANTDDGSCTAVVLGCTDATAFNYNPAANTDDGSCIAVVLGCTEASAFNYNAAANTDDGSCIAVVLGCTDATAFNYNAAANTDDGSCIAVVLGCTDASAFNYNAAANTNDGSCIAVVEGCTDINACNYDFSANVDNGSCILPQQEICNDLDDNCDGQIDEDVLLTFYADFDQDGFGNVDDVTLSCTQPNGYVADNTDCNDEDDLTYPGAVEICDNNRDEDCDGQDLPCAINVLGCTDPSACNFNSDANTDDGSCILPQPEICNGLDDNCDGAIDEGLTLNGVNVVSTITAIYPTCSGSSIKSANLNNGFNTGVIEGNGNDLWFSFSAQYNTLRAGLSAASGDNDIRLYEIAPSGCLQLLEVEHESTSGNQTLITDQLTVGSTYYIAVHNISGAMNASAKICFNHLTGSICDHYYSNNTGIYTSVCNSFKAQYRANAVAYTFDVLSSSQNGVNQNITPWSYTTTGSSSVVSRLGSILPANQGTAPVVYTMRVPVVYSLPDAAGNLESLTALATSTCNLTLNAETTIALRSSDRCPNNKSISNYVAPDRTVCGAMRYDWEFTEVLPNPSSAQVVQGGVYSGVFFLSNIPGVAVGKTYNVRVRPVHTSGTIGNWGAAHCMRIGAAGMILQSGNESEVSMESRVSNISIYPNPTTTESFVLQYNGSRRGESIFAQEPTTTESIFAQEPTTTESIFAQEPTTTESIFAHELRMLDITGKVVYQKQVILNGNAVEVQFGDLVNGIYLVEFGNEHKRIHVMK